MIIVETFEKVMIREILNASFLTDWETNFIEGIKDAQTITTNQENTLHEIHDARVS